MSENLPDVEKFELTTCCEIGSHLRADEQVTTIGGSPSVIFLGTNIGRIFHVKNNKDSWKIAGNIELPLKQELRQIEFASALDIILVLCDNVLFDIELGSFEIVSNRSSVQHIAVNTNPQVDDPFALQIAIATTSKQLQICERRNGKLEILQKLSVDGIISAMQFSRLTVCFAVNGMYNIYNLSSKTFISLFPFDPQVIRPQICTVDMEFLVSGMDGLLISVTEQGVSVRPPVVIPSTVIEDMVCNSPYVYIRSTTEILIVSLEDARISQSVSGNEVKVLRVLDGSVFVCSNEWLSNLSMLSVEKQVNLLYSYGQYEKAISLFQSKLSRHFDVESLVEFVSLKKKIAFKYMEEQMYEKAAELLIETEVNPEEVIAFFKWPSDIKSVAKSPDISEGYQFLEEYLLQIRKLHFALGVRTIVDSCVLKLFTIHEKVDEVLSLEDFSPDYDEAAIFLESYQHYNYAAEMWLRAKKPQKAWDIWRRLSLNELQDDNFCIDAVIDRISSVNDKDLLTAILSWCISLAPERCMKIIVSTPVLDYATVRKMLDGNASYLRLYLESVPFNDDVAKELCNIYINDITRGDTSCRRRFMRLLLKMNISERSAVYDRLPEECGVERLLCDSSLSAGDILDKVVIMYHDYDAAELICSHYSPTQPDICLNLLKFLEDRELSSTEDSETRICSLLKCMSDSVDPGKVITVLPESTSFDQVSFYLMRAVAKKQQEQHLLQYRACLLDKYAEVEKSTLPNEKIVIEDKTACVVCKKPISGNDVLCYLKTGFIVHNKCMKYENLCPLTNSLLVLPE
ncbi:hypothetical protein Q1695_001362 [Nippostrongylus brasiliensis]|nr:hypothetical protein Q1695_001362 [Nippostrongylus brasiliensis]